MPRPTKLTPEVQKRITDALRAGNTRTASAAYAGVGASTFHLWMEQGRAAKSGALVEFVEAVEKAEGDAEVGAVAIIKKAMSTQWTAAAWWLERRRAKDYARKNDPAISLTPEELRGLTDAELDELDAALQEGRTPRINRGGK